MIVRSENNIDKQDVKSLINCSHWSLKFMLIFLILVFTSFLTFCIAVDNIGKNFSYCIVGITWCALVYAYSFIINPKLAYKSFKKKYLKDAVVKFKLTDKNFAVTIVNENGTWDKRKNYQDMFKAYETPDYFFFYTKRNESYIMKKSGIHQGEASDITEALTKEMGAKFIRKVK